MRVPWWLACAAARPPGHSLDAYFDIAERIWTDSDSTAAKCLAIQRRQGWLPVAHGSRYASLFNSVGSEGAGHHWLASLELEACGKRRRCGGLSSFSKGGDSCDRKDAGKGKVKFKKRRGVDYAWRCFAGDTPNYPRLETAVHHVVLVRDAVASFESVLRRFWIWNRGGDVDSLAREENMLATALDRLEARVKKLDCQRTLFFDYEVARSAPRAHAAALAVFLGLPPSHAAIHEWFDTSASETGNASVEDADCFGRVAPWLPRLRAYAAWLDAGGEAPEEGCAEAVAPFVRACVNASDDGRGCAAAWRDRQVRCGALLRARHTTFAPDRPPARCKGI